MNITTFTIGGKMNRIVLPAVFIAIIIFLLSGCGGGAPQSFMRMNKQYWEVINIKPSIKYNEAWERVIYIITKKFELEMISKEDGYVRSAWGPSYFTEDIQRDNYQVRIVGKFSPDRKKFEFKIESHVWDGKIYQNGSDVRVAANMRKDFLNSLGVPQKKKQKPVVPADSLEQAPAEPQEEPMLEPHL